jgi:hypothetical protein
VLGWWWVHKRATGWAVSPPDETYGTHREAVGLMGMARNAAILLWRVLDQGRVFVVCLIAALLLLKARRNAPEGYPLKPLLWILVVPMATWALFFIPLSNPIGHRYWMVSYACLALVAAWLLSTLKKPWLRGALSAALLCGLLSGHWWLYPDPIAKGWDSTLAHHDWFVVQRQMDDHLRSKGIVQDICTDFPNLVNHGISRLEPTSFYPQQYLPYQEHKDAGCEWVVQGNVMNGFEKEDLNHLAQHYRLEQEFRSGHVYLRLFRRKQ